MQQLDVCRKESGKIFCRKPGPSNDGLLLSIVHSVASTLPLGARNVRFLHVAFDAIGDRFIAGDCQGNIFLFDLHSNKFQLVQKTGSPCSALAFALRRRSEYLVAMADRSLKCFDTESKELVAMMQGHESTIHAISVHASGRYAMATSADSAQLWDLDSFQRKRKLTVKEEVPIVKVFFLPTSNAVIMCFKDDSIFAWDSETMQSLFHLHVPVPGEKPAPSFKAFAASRDGRLLVAGGRSRFLHVWSLESQRLLRVVELPRKVTSVSQLEFLPDSFDTGINQILGVLCQDGILRFINLGTFVQVFDVGRLDDRVSNFIVSSNGRHIVAVMDSGNVNIYNAHSLVQQLNKPPPPLVKVLRSSRHSADTTGTSSTSAAKTVRNPKHVDDSHATSQSAVSASATTADLSGDRLMSILKGYGEYPAKYRMFIWRTILRLPENHAAYAALVEKGTHPAYERLHEKYPVKSQKLQRVLQRVLSALAHWSPIFGETEFLPMLTFPFVKLFQNNQLVCFEIVATTITSWCQHWFEYFPNPPINILSMAENILAYHDKELLGHLVRHGVTSQTYAWLVLQTLFSEVLTRDEWLRLMDNVFSNHPAFLLMAVVAYSIIGRSALMRCSERDDFEYYFHHRNAMSVTQLINEAYHLMDATPADIHPQNILEDFNPLTNGQYPIFNKYPKFIVDYQVQERERIRKEEEEYVRQQSLATDLRVEMQKRQQEEEGWYRQQQLLAEAEQARRNIIAEEERKLAEQRTRLLAMNREARMKELQLLDAARRKFMTFTQQQKETELARLDDEIRRKAELREAETQAAIQEIEIKNMELQLQKKLFEQELHREYADLTHRHSTDLEARDKQQQRRVTNLRSGTLSESGLLTEQQTRTTLQRSLAHAEQLHNDAELRGHAEHLNEVEEREADKAAELVERLRLENRLLEENIQQTMHRLETQRVSEATARNRVLTSQPHRTVPGVSMLSRTTASAPSRNETGDVEPDDDPYESQNSEFSGSVSFNRDRQALDDGERHLLADVHRLRQRLAQNGRQRKPIPA